MLTLVQPGPEYLAEYKAALEAGWSPSTVRDLSGEQLAAIGADPAAFLADVGREEGGTVTTEDGTVVPRLPQRVRWMWDAASDGGAFCGSINLRFQPGTLDLPPHVSGHIGYTVVPWKRRRGCARRALALMLQVAAGVGLPRVLVTCDVSNVASRGVIEANGGSLAGETPGTANAEGKFLFWLQTQ